MMTPEQALAYIHGTQKFGWKPGLTRVHALLAKLGNPHCRLRYVHVAGTKGKGSTCAMTASILQEAGHKTGLYTSPYLEDFAERMRIDGTPIAPEELARRTEEIKAAVDSLLAEGGLQPTEFELITALAFAYFADEHCDAVVLEVGMGGRFDATNVIEAPEVAVITSMSMDHMEYLGDTLPKITGEKCGILKPGCHAVTCLHQAPEALEVIRESCRGLGVPLRIPSEDELSVREIDLTGSLFSYRGQEFALPLIGAVQVENALSALLTIDALRERGWRISDEAAVRGLRKTVWPGRFELLRGGPGEAGPLCVIDGAHNRDSLTKLCDTVDRLLPRERRRIVIMGMLGDKEFEAGIRMLACRADVFLAVPPEGPRALPVEQIAACAEQECAHVERFASPAQAAARALALCGEDGVVLACGSLYLIGALRTALKKTP